MSTANPSSLENSWLTVECDSSMSSVECDTSMSSSPRSLSKDDGAAANVAPSAASSSAGAPGADGPSLAAPTQTLEPCTRDALEPWTPTALEPWTGRTLRAGGRVGSTPAGKTGVPCPEQDAGRVSSLNAGASESLAMTSPVRRLLAPDDELPPGETAAS